MLARLIPLLVTVLATAGSASAAPGLGANLLRNPSAEAIGDALVPGWTGPAPVFSSDEYGHVSGEWDWGVSGCAACGKRYLRLQFEDEQSRPAAEQIVDLASFAADIDAGKVSAHVSGEVGGYREADTTAWVEADFEDAAGKPVGVVKTAPFEPATLPAPTVGGTSLTLLQADGPVPAGARKARFRFVAKPTGASANYLAAGDDFALVLRR
jgi:hypothetical protein